MQRGLVTFVVLLAAWWEPSLSQESEIEHNVAAIQLSLNSSIQVGNLSICEVFPAEEVSEDLMEMEIIELLLENGTVSQPTPSPFPTYYYLNSGQICVRPNIALMGDETCRCPGDNPNCGFEGSEFEPTSYYCYKAMPEEPNGPEYFAEGLLLNDEAGDHGPRVFVGTERIGGSGETVEDVEEAQEAATESTEAEEAPAAPEEAPEAPAEAPDAPAEAPVAPAEAPAAREEAPVAPAEAPVAPE